MRVQWVRGIGIRPPILGATDRVDVTTYDGELRLDVAVGNVIWPSTFSWRHRVVEPIGQEALPDPACPPKAPPAHVIPKCYAWIRGNDVQPYGLETDEFIDVTFKNGKLSLERAVNAVSWINVFSWRRAIHDPTGPYAMPDAECPNPLPVSPPTPPRVRYDGEVQRSAEHIVAIELIRALLAEHTMWATLIYDRAAAILNDYDNEVLWTTPDGFDVTRKMDAAFREWRVTL